MKSIIKHIRLALRGRRIWFRVRKQYSVGEATCLFLMPHDDSELNLYAIRYLEPYLIKKHFNHAILLTGNEEVKEIFEVMHREDAYNVALRIDIVIMPYDDILAVCKLYQLLQFFEDIKVVSLDEPYGSSGFINKKGYSMDDLVQHMIFGW